MRTYVALVVLTLHLVGILTQSLPGAYVDLHNSTRSADNSTTPTRNNGSIAGVLLLGSSAEKDSSSSITSDVVQVRSKRNLFAHHPMPFKNVTTPCDLTSDEDYPDFISKEYLAKGAVIVPFLIGIYCFTILAIICDSYFLPCVEKICDALNLSQDVAAATFMSVATSAPELFVNIIGTFVTESDIGVGTVVGSSLFNSLGVASIGGLAATVPLQLHWWPVTRDVIIYMLAVCLLVSITWDGVIFWYEGLVLFMVYFCYFTVMFQNKRISAFVKRMLKKRKANNQVGDIEKQPPPLPPMIERLSMVSHYGSYCEEPKKKFIEEKEADMEEDQDIFRFPRGSFWKQIFYIYSFPIKLALFCTIPNPQKYPKLFPLTFLACIFWIGTNSYVVSWMIALIGGVFNIPDAVLGLTFLAAGGCLPEAISITIMSRRGEGSMGVSNSLGANTMNILLSLGMPWFLKTILMGANDESYIVLDSGSIRYTVSALVFVAVALYLTLYINKFRLSRLVGLVLISIYTVCIVLAILSEMIFFRNDQCAPKVPVHMY